MLAPMHLIPISDLADVEPVLKEMGESLVVKPL